MCFRKILNFDARPPETDLRMPLNSFLELFWEPSSLTFYFLVAPVAKRVDIFVSSVASTKNDCSRGGRGMACGLRQKVGARGGTQLIDFKNKDLVYLCLNACFRSATGPSYWQPGGLVPRARGRIYRLPPLPPISQKVGWR